MYGKGDLAFLVKKELVGGPWTTQGSMVMDTLHYPVTVVDTTYLGDGIEELGFVIQHLCGKQEIVFQFNLTKLC